MGISTHHILFTLQYSGQTHHIQTHWGEYRDLRALIMDKLDLEDFGQCGGMGRCATCLVAITGLEGEASLMKRNEPVTMEKLGIHLQDVRLSCQIQVDDDLANIMVSILDNP